MRFALWHCFNVGGVKGLGRVQRAYPCHASLEVTSSARDVDQGTKKKKTDQGTMAEQRHAGGSFPFIH